MNTFAEELRDIKKSIPPKSNRELAIDAIERIKTQQAKDVKDKPPWALVELHLLEGIAFQRQYGNSKYAKDSWKNVSPEHYVSALIRHISALTKDGIDLNRKDKEGRLHLWAILTNAYFLEYFRKLEDGLSNTKNS